tara:strand:- start:37 stop:930 length:894 start_codon:yes stop_codon:yes gene_type:complete
MKKEVLISKWLDNDLNDQELEAFKKLEDYDDLMTLSNNLKAFKADDYDTSQQLESVLKTIKNTHKKTHWIKPFIRVAAILAISFSLYYYTTTLDTTISTAYAEMTTVKLPDASTVSLNAKTYLAYNKKSWKHERHVELDGEAFFKVAKGSTFIVNTKAGTVAVYGTKFNIKQRENYFEVICYEGVVGVTYNSQLSKLKAGDRFLIIDGKIIATEKENNATPSWLHNESQFKSLPYKMVLEEFERQYNVTLVVQNIDTEQLFSGSFGHNNLEVALNAITLPLHLTYSKTGHTITLKRE